MDIKKIVTLEEGALLGGFGSAVFQIFENYQRKNPDFVSVEVVEEGEEVWPTLEQLITSGQLGKDILSILATLKPFISFVEANFPQYASMISWITTILTDIANFTVVNTPCTCPGCTTN